MRQVPGIAILHHFTYVSSAVTLFSRDDLAELLGACRLANERRAVTGMLLYKDGNFMQTVEGPEGAIVELRDRLQADERHTGILILLSGTREKRVFDGWSMGFKNLGDADLTVTPGYSEFLDAPLTAAEFGENPAASQRLLLSFKRKMR